MTNTAINAKNIDDIGKEKITTRDVRYKQLLSRQLGTNGINLLVAYSFILIVLLLLVILSTVGYTNTFRGGSSVLLPTAPPIPILLD